MAPAVALVTAAACCLHSSLRCFGLLAIYLDAPWDAGPIGAQTGRGISPRQVQVCYGRLALSILLLELSGYC